MYLENYSEIIKCIFMMPFLNVFASCDKSDPADTEINPFSNVGNEKNMIVIIRDLHLGADLDYSECKNNLPSLEKLLNQIKAAPDVKELVIAGDLLEEWFVPATTDTYQGKDQADFVKRIATASKGVFDAINSIHSGREYPARTKSTHLWSIRRNRDICCPERHLLKKDNTFQLMMEHQNLELKI